MTEKPQYDRRYRSIDHLLLRLHERLSSLAATSGASAPSEQRQVPGAELEQTQLGDDDRKHAGPPPATPDRPGRSGRTACAR